MLLEMLLHEYARENLMVLVGVVMGHGPNGLFTAQQDP